MDASNKCPETNSNNPLFYSNTSSSDEYYSANSSPICSDVEPDTESFEEAAEDVNVFIEGYVINILSVSIFKYKNVLFSFRTTPTKIDYTVYTAIKGVDISVNDFPNIYRWKHTMKYFPEDEMMR